AKGGPLGQGMVQKAMAKARVALGLPQTATPTALRPGFATTLLGAGADLRSLQELLGHASLGSTQIYTKVDAAVMLQTYRRGHPREPRYAGCRMLSDGPSRASGVRPVAGGAASRSRGATGRIPRRSRRWRRPSSRARPA